MANDLLHKSDREFILRELTNAPDSVLAQAYHAWSIVRAACLVVRADSAGPKTGPQTEPVAAETPAEEPPKPRVNKSPGKPTIGKIGQATVADLTKMLSDGKQPPKRFEQHMRLLWERKIVGFDGAEYYLL